MPDRNAIPRMLRPPNSVRLLTKRRTWFADEGGENGREGQDSQNGQQGGDGLDAKYKPKDLDSAETIIQSLLKRVNERDGTIQTQQGQIDDLKHRMDNIDGDRKKRLAEEGKFQDLLKEREQELEGYKPYKDEAESLRQVIQAGNEKLISQIPEDRRSIVPDLTPAKLREWLDTNLSLLTRQAAPDFDAGAGGNNGGGREAAPKLTPDEQVVLQKTGMSAEDFAKAKKALGTPE